MDIKQLTLAAARVAAKMAENRDRLIALDQANGDGDLGISMSEGYAAMARALEGSGEKDLGRALMRSASAFNEAAPSTLGTITSVLLMGMARSLKGKEEASLEEVAAAMRAGLEAVMDKAKSKPGEKTILDAFCPAVDALRGNASSGSRAAFAAAAAAAKAGSEATKGMRSVHGRAAYYGDKSLGVVDGGSVAGALVFEALAEFCEAKD